MQVNLFKTITKSYIYIFHFERYPTGTGHRTLANYFDLHSIGVYIVMLHVANAKHPNQQCAIY